MITFWSSRNEQNPSRFSWPTSSGSYLTVRATTSAMQDLDLEPFRAELVSDIESGGDWAYSERLYLCQSVCAYRRRRGLLHRPILLFRGSFSAGEWSLSCRDNRKVTSMKAPLRNGIRGKSQTINPIPACCFERPQGNKGRGRACFE